MKLSNVLVKGLNEVQSFWTLLPLPLRQGRTSIMYMKNGEYSNKMLGKQYLYKIGMRGEIEGTEQE